MKSWPEANESRRAAAADEREDEADCWSKRLPPRMTGGALAEAYWRDQGESKPLSCASSSPSEPPEPLDELAVASTTIGGDSPTLSAAARLDDSPCASCDDDEPCAALSEPLGACPASTESSSLSSCGADGGAQSA